MRYWKIIFRISNMIKIGPHVSTTDNLTDDVQTDIISKTTFDFAQVTSIPRETQHQYFIYFKISYILEFKIFI